MSKKQINTIEELNDALGVKSLNEITGDKVNALISLISCINPDMLDKVITAIPVSADALSKLAREVSLMYDENYTKIVGNNETIKAYKDILDIVKRESNKPDLSFEDMEKYIEKMTEIAKEISREERIKEDYDREIREQKTAFIISLVAACLIFAIVLTICIIIPGIVIDIIFAVVGLVSIMIIFLINNRKKKRIKIKYGK